MGIILKPVVQPRIRRLSNDAVKEIATLTGDSGRSEGSMTLMEVTPGVLF